MNSFTAIITAATTTTTNNNDIRNNLLFISDGEGKTWAADHEILPDIITEI
jgi:hypothetical protein